MGLGGAVRILRPGNALMAAAGVAIGYLGVGGELRHASWAYLAPLSAALLTSFGNVLNDLRDEAVDRTAHPSRPLVAGALQRRTATAMAWALACAGILCVYRPGDAALSLVAALVTALLLWYEMALKRAGLPGNVAVALLTGATFAFGAAATTAPPLEWGGVWVLAGMAVLVNLGREVVKDVEDFDADLRRRRTLPHRVGARRAVQVAAVAVMAGVALNLGWLAATGLWHGPLAALAAADLLLLGSMALAPSQPATAQRGLKLGMAVALLVFAAHVAWPWAHALALRAA